MKKVVYLCVVILALFIVLQPESSRHILGFKLFMIHDQSMHVAIARQSDNVPQTGMVVIQNHDKYAVASSKDAAIIMNEVRVYIRQKEDTLYRVIFAVPLHRLLVGVVFILVIKGGYEWKKRKLRSLGSS